jgi:hypothetical protein
MSRIRTVSIVFAAACFACLPANAQETSSGFSLPLEFTGNLLYGNLPTSETRAPSFSPGFRTSAYPTLQLGSHWFVYSALDVQSSSLFGYESGPENDSPVRFHVLQAFAGYNATIRNASIQVKAGRLGSASMLF